MSDRNRNTLQSNILVPECEEEMAIVEMCLILIIEFVLEHTHRHTILTMKLKSLIVMLLKLIGFAGFWDTFDLLFSILTFYVNAKDIECATNSLHPN